MGGGFAGVIKPLSASNGKVYKEIENLDLCFIISLFVLLCCNSVLPSDQIASISQFLICGYFLQPNPLNSFGIDCYWQWFQVAKSADF